jgi:DNA repair exonuclease SbcCD nuclease subunit
MDFTILGDPHLGRTFVHGVPLHRRGEREAVLWRDFAQSLSNVTTPLHICLGDLFDRAVVSYDTIVSAARLYMHAAAKFPETKFIILRGNHDTSRDADKVSAFDVFSLIVEGVENICPVTEPVNIDGYWFFPWDPVRSAAELVSQYATPAPAASGHWNITGDDHNLIPVQELAAAGIAKAYTGHTHLPQKFTRAGVEVIVTGSMQPLAHGEDPEERLYVTRSLAEVEADPDAYKDKCLRVDLKPGEVFDLEIDCLQLTVRRPEEELADETVVLGDFDLMALFETAFETEGVPEPFREKIIERYQTLKMAQ